MNATQLHLMMNHLPVIGALFVAVALAAGLAFRSAAVLRFGLVVLVGVSLAAIPVFLTGKPAEERVEHIAGVSSGAIEAHEDAARAALVALVVFGVAALALLWRDRGRDARRAPAATMLVFMLGLCAMLAWTAHLGGRIRHPEIVAGSVADRLDAGTGHDEGVEEAR